MTYTALQHGVCDDMLRCTQIRTPGKECGMGQIRSFDDALDFYPDTKASLRTRLHSFTRSVATYLAAMAEGHAAASHYNALRARGLSHDHAASKVFADHFAKS